MKFSAWEVGYIVGAVTESEGRRLAHLAAHVPEGTCIVELGSHGGSSASWLALGAHKAGNPATIYAVDLWDHAAGDRLEQHAQRAVRDRFDAQMRFMASAGYIDADQVVPIARDSQWVASTWADGALERPPVGLLHVDALHTYEAVIADVDAWSPHLAPGAVVVFHDWSNRRMGVRKAALEVERRPGWTRKGAYEGDRQKGRHGQLILRAPL